MEVSSGLVSSEISFYIDGGLLPGLHLVCPLGVSICVLISSLRDDTSQIGSGSHFNLITSLKALSSNAVSF